MSVAQSSKFNNSSQSSDHRLGAHTDTLNHGFQELGFIEAGHFRLQQDYFLISMEHVHKIRVAQTRSV